MAPGLRWLALILMMLAASAAAATAAPAPPSTPDEPPPVEAPPNPSPSAPPVRSAPAAPTTVAPAQSQESEAARRAEEQRAARALAATRRAARRRAQRDAAAQLRRIERIADETLLQEQAARSARAPVLKATADQRMSRAVDVAVYASALLLLIVALLFALFVFGVDPAWSITTGLGLSIFAGNWSLMGLPPLDRAFLIAGVIALLARIGPSQDRPVLRPGLVHLVLVAVVLYAIVSALFVGTLTQANGFYGLIDKLAIVPFVMFAIAPLAFSTPRQRAILLGGMVVVGGYLGLIALLEGIGADQLVIPAYINDPSIGLHFGRARGPFLEAAANGLALIACGTAAAVALAVWKNAAGRATAAVVLALCSLGTLFTLTRAIWLATIIAGVTTLLATRELRRFVLPVLVVGAIAVLAVLSFVPQLSDDASARGAEQRPVWDRLNLTDAGVRAVEAKPLFGSGWATNREHLQEYFRQSDAFPLTGTQNEIHNLFLSFAVELGLVGVTLWSFALLLAVGGGILTRGPPELRPFKVGLLAIALSWLVVANFVPLFFSFANLVLWTWAGVASSHYAVARRAAAEAATAHAPDSGRARQAKVPEVAGV